MLQIYNIPANFNRLAVLILDAAWTLPTEGLMTGLAEYNVTNDKAVPPHSCLRHGYDSIIAISALIGLHGVALKLITVHLTVGDKVESIMDIR